MFIQSANILFDLTKWTIWSTSMELFFIISASTKRYVAIRQSTTESVVVVTNTCSSRVNDASGSRLAIVELVFSLHSSRCLCLAEPVAPKAL